MAVAYGYTRVSDEHQVASGLSLAAQQQACERKYKELLVAHPLLKWGHCFTDAAVSGSVPFLDRPAGRALQDRVKDGDFIIAAMLDRVFRDLEDCIRTNNMWLRMDINPCYLDVGTDSKDPMFIPIVVLRGVFSHMELTRIRARIQQAVDQKRQRGEAISRRPPIGFEFYKGRRENGHFVKKIRPDPNAELMASYIIDMRAGGWSYPKIAYMLNESGIKSPIGERWGQMNVPYYYRWGIKKGFKGNR